MRSVGAPEEGGQVERGCASPARAVIAKRAIERRELVTRIKFVFAVGLVGGRTTARAEAWLARSLLGGDP